MVVGTTRLKSARRIAAVAVLLLLAVVGLVAIVADDEAEREYMAYLRGDEDGSTDAQRRAHLDRAIELAPDRARYHESRALLNIDRGDDAAALSDFDRAIALSDRPYLRYLRGLTLCHLGEHPRALHEFDVAISEQPDNAQFYGGRTLASIAAERTTQALADGNRMVAMAPSWPRAHFARGAALAAVGRHADAIEDYDQALSRDPRLVYVWEARAQSWEQLENAHRARDDRAEAARLEPQSHAAERDPLRY